MRIERCRRRGVEARRWCRLTPAVSASTLAFCSPRTWVAEATSLVHIADSGAGPPRPSQLLHAGEDDRLVLTRPCSRELHDADGAWPGASEHGELEPVAAQN